MTPEQAIQFDAKLDILSVAVKTLVMLQVGFRFDGDAEVGLEITEQRWIDNPDLFARMLWRTPRVFTPPPNWSSNTAPTTFLVDLTDGGVTVSSYTTKKGKKEVKRLFLEAVLPREPRSG